MPPVELRAGNRWRPVSLVLLPILALLGCGSAPESANGLKPGVPGKRVGAVLPTFAHPFFIAQKAGLESRAKELGLRLDVRDGRDDDRTQIEQVELLLSTGVDAIILCPRDQDAVGRAVKSANADKVPVIALNRRVRGGAVVAYVGANDVDAGRAQGRALVQTLGPEGGRVLYLQGTQGSSPQVERAQGLKEILADHPEITIAEERYCDFQADQAKADMTVLVQRYKSGEIRAIVAQNDEMALPAARVARGEGWTDVVVVGCDGTAGAFEAIRSGLLHATVLQDAAEQGRLAVNAVADVLNDNPPAADILTPLPVITRENVDRYKPSY
jgi:ABC-type sugar transport system substrate-binding protein